MLHIHNGDSAANTAKQSALAGRHIAWRESLITGPTPAGLSATEWRHVRAKHLSQAYGVDEKECERDLLTQEQMLASSTQHEEVVLWFEHDLYCQVHLLYLLHWFSQHDAGKTRLSLICIGEFPGIANFHGLGELNAEQLASLFPARKQLTSQELNLASLAWQDYCSEDPESLADILHADTAALPFLRAALSAHIVKHARLELTEFGRSVMEGAADFVVANGIDLWLGGVHLHGGNNLWRWDEQSQALVST